VGISKEEWMDQQRDDLENNPEAWDRAAREHNFRCHDHGGYIEFKDRDVYRDTGGEESGLCGYCAVNRQADRFVPGF
jgi:hypothetical protein